MSAEEVRYRFMNDDDGHWYLIPSQLEKEFRDLLESAEYDEFNDKFYNHYYVGCHPNCYTFEKPKEEY